VQIKTLNILFALFLTVAASVAHGSVVLPGAQPQETATQEQQSEAGWMDHAVAWVWTKQRKFHRRLTSELNELAEKEGSALFLIFISFLYGIFHAAGPGHGKAVITTYLLAHGPEVRRGIAMASAAALLQGITAIVLVYGLIFLSGWLPSETRNAVDWTERFSFLLVAAIGIYLLWRGVRSLKNAISNSDTAPTAACGCGQCDIQPEQIKQAKDWRAILGVVFAIGMRPCSGAVLLLIFAHAMHIHWAGVGAVVAMSAGTAITVSTLALLAVNARHLVVSLTEHRSTRFWSVSGGMVILLAGLLIFYLGISLLIYSFGPQHPLGL
jgi:ABC-type nickel/cobalt efflux system permease component RcnA